MSDNNLYLNLGYDDFKTESPGSIVETQRKMVEIVTNDASKIIPQSDIIIFTVPSFAREALLKKIISISMIKIWLSIINLNQ